MRQPIFDYLYLSMWVPIKKWFVKNVLRNRDDDNDPFDNPYILL